MNVSLQIGPIVRNFKPRYAKCDQQVRLMRSYSLLKKFRATRFWWACSHELIRLLISVKFSSGHFAALLAFYRSSGSVFFILEFFSLWGVLLSSSKSLDVLEFPRWNWLFSALWHYIFSSFCLERLNSKVRCVSDEQCLCYRDQPSLAFVTMSLVSTYTTSIRLECSLLASFWLKCVV